MFFNQILSRTQSAGVLEDENRLNFEKKAKLSIRKFLTKSSLRFEKEISLENDVHKSLVNEKFENKLGGSITNNQYCLLCSPFISSITILLCVLNTLYS